MKGRKNKRILVFSWMPRYASCSLPVSDYWNCKSLKNHWSQWYNADCEDLLKTKNNILDPEKIIKKDKYHLLAVSPSGCHITSLFFSFLIFEVWVTYTYLGSYVSIKQDDVCKVLGQCWNMVPAQWILGKRSWPILHHRRTWKATFPTGWSLPINGLCDQVTGRL